MVIFAGCGIAFFATGKSVTAAARAQQAAALSVVSAASFSDGALAPDSIAAAFGQGLATATATAQDTDAAMPGVQLPKTLAGTTVKVNGIAAPLMFVSPQQINFVIPAEVAPGSGAQDLAAIEVTAGDGSVTAGQVHIANIAPAIFTADGTGSGVPAAYLVRVKPDQQQVIEPLVTRDATGALIARSIDLGSEQERVFLILYLSGIRRAPDLDRDGNSNESVRVLLNGYEVTPSFAGRHSEYAGLDQINCEIPRSFLGNQKLTVRITTAATTTNGLSAVAAAASDAPASNLTEIPLAVPPVTQAQWQSAGLESLDIHALAAKGEILILGTSDGIYRSVDDGVNFIPAKYAFPLPPAGRRTLIFTSLKGNGYVAGTAGNGVWNASEDGEAWIWFESDTPLKEERILALANVAGNVYAGTDGKGVYRSTRNNDSPRWRSIGLGGQKITALAISGGKLFAAVSTGLQMTANNGETWESAATGLPANTVINTLAVNGTTLYAGTSAGLWQSINSGGAWTELKLGLSSTPGVQTILIDDNNFFVGTDGSGIAVSNDAGKTWKLINEGLTNRNVLSLANYAGRLFAGTKGGGVFATLVAPTSNLPPVAVSQTITLDEDTSATIKLTGSDPNDDPIKFKLLTQPRYGNLTGEPPNLTYVPYENYNGTDSFIFLVQDGKTSSRFATISFAIRPVNDPPKLSVGAPDTSVIGGLMIVGASAYDPDNEPVTVTATALPSGATLLPTPPDEQRVIVKLLPTAAGAYKFGFAASQNGGAPITREVTVTVVEPQPSQDWAQVPLFFDKRVAQLLPVVEPSGATTLYVVAQEIEQYRFGGLYRSADGRTWTRLGQDLPANLSDLPRLSESGGKLYLDTSQGFFRSTDQGATFVNITTGKGLPDEGKYLQLKVVGGRLLAWTSNRLFHSSNDGATWTEITSNLPFGDSGRDGGRMKDALAIGNVLIASLSYGIQDNGARTYRSFDNGATWQFVDANDAVSLYLFLDGDSIYGLSAIFLHRSDDQGATWPVLNPLFQPGRPDSVIPNTALAVRNGVLLLFYSNGQLYRSADQGQHWTALSGTAPASITELLITPQWFYTTTYDGLVYARPNQ